MTPVALEYIELDDRGIARLIGSRIKVVNLIMSQRAGELSFAELHAQFSHLSLAQIHAAYTYYYSNKETVDSQIEDDLRLADQLRILHPNDAVTDDLEDQQLVSDRITTP